MFTGSFQNEGGIRPFPEENTPNSTSRLRRRRAKPFLPLLLFGILLIITSGCDATATDCTSDTFLVTTTEDIFDGACSGHCSLREAVHAANTCTLHDIYPIELPPGHIP